MPTATYTLDTDRLARCIDASKHVRWNIDRDVIRGREFDTAQTFCLFVCSVHPNEGEPSMPNAFDSFIERIDACFSGITLTPQQLQLIAKELLDFCTEVSWDQAKYRPANFGEALLYELAVSSQSGPSLYLVSDGVGVSTPPHEHQTWAIIVGIQGEEYNVLYRADDTREKKVSKIAERRVGPGDVFVMEPHDIHAIDDTRGRHPTYHVHLYGCPLASLSSFESRCYVSDDRD
ncbi:hypothetical protein C2W62_16410 [Candidatus Entotheonella serta]|nr:hypothetical protein C2W62_16410 [Candidatus Entotheonella serta]